jgi:hypothetical protein
LAASTSRSASRSKTRSCSERSTARSSGPGASVPREVQERARDRRRSEPVDDLDVARTQRRAAVHDDSVPAPAPAGGRDGDVNRARAAAPQPAPVAGGDVAEGRLRAEREQRRQAAAVVVEPCVADREHTAVQAMQPPGADAVVDRIGAEARGAQLPVGDDPVLGSGELRDTGIRSPFDEWMLHVDI